MQVSECCGSIPWNDTDICAECKEHTNFIYYVEYNTRVLSQTPTKETVMNKEILNLITERLDEGKRKYGHENVETDGRNFITEALEEILDCCVYVAAKLIEVRREMSPLPNHCIICDKPTMNTLCVRCKEKEMNVTGMLAIGNGEKCPYCETIMDADSDTIGHMIENHQEKLKKVLYGEN